MTNKSPEQRFWEKVKKTATCWVWVASSRGKNYGGFRAYGKVWTAHRFSWELNVGYISNGLHVLHKCDNPSCVKPSHLFLGTNLDNVRDKISKGRQKNVRGEKHGYAKLTEKEVRKIRQLQANGALHRELAKQFHVSKGTIGFIIRKETWSHI